MKKPEGMNNFYDWGPRECELAEKVTDIHEKSDNAAEVITRIKSICKTNGELVFCFFWLGFIEGYIEGMDDVKELFLKTFN